MIKVRVTPNNSNIIFHCTSEITWFFNRQKVEPSSGVVMSTTDTKSHLNITSATNEHVGFYSCKAKNEVGEAVTLGKFDIASTTSVLASETTRLEKETKVTEVVHEQTHLPSYETVIESITKQESFEKIESNTVIILHNLQLSLKEIVQEKVETLDFANFCNDPELKNVLAGISKENYGPGLDTIKELTIIEYLMGKGSNIDDIKNIYNTNGFTALKQPESQFALVQFIERAGHGKLITDILIAEHVADDELLASTVGFLAFLKLLELNHTTIKHVICQLSHEDFTRQDWKSMEGKEVLLI